MGLGMNLQHLRHLVALADLGSFSRAAEHCHLTQPALSRSIAQLEDELGLQLIDRVGRRNEITASGHSVLERARKILFETDELVHNAQLQASGGGGHIRLGLGSTPAALLTAPLLLYTANRGSDLRLSISRGTAEQQIEALFARELDAAVLALESIVPTPQLYIEPLASGRAGLVCRAAHPLAKHGELTFDALQAWPKASTLLSDEQVRVVVETFGMQANPSHAISLRCEDIGSMLNVVSHSDTIFFGVLTAALPMIASGVLTELPVRPALPNAPFGIVRLAGRSMLPAFAQIQAIIHEHMGV